MRLLLLLSIAAITSACAAPLKVTKIGQSSLAGQRKVLALLTGTQYDADVRLSLAQHGFKTVKFAFLKRIERDTNDTTRETFNKAESRYGLSVYPGRVVDSCTINDGVKLGRSAFELTDLAENETVLFLHAGGWTDVCGVRSNLVWDTLAKALADNWR